MKKINEIIMKNIKGQDTVQVLTGKDIIIGPNGSGKSTRMQALGIALMGYTPGQGKKAEETFKLASADTMVVGLKTDDFNFTREFKKKTSKDKEGLTKESTQQKLNVSPSKGETKISDKESRILSELGNFPVMLDFNEFLNLSDVKRREFIYNLAGFDSDKWTKDKVKEYLENKLLTTELEVNNEEQHRLMKSIINEVLEEYPEKYGITQGLQSMADWTKDKLSYWNNEKKRSQAAVQKIGELKNKLNDTDRNLKINKEELEKLQENLVKVEKQISGDIQKKKNIDLKLAKIEQLKKQIGVESIKQNPFNEKEIEASIKELRSKIQKVDYSENIEVFNGILRHLETKIDEVSKDKEDVRTKTIEIVTKIKTLQETLNKVKSTNCRCIIDSKIKCDKNFEKFIEFIDKQIKNLELKKGILTSTFNELEEKAASLENQKTVVNSDKSKLIEAERSAYKSNNRINDEIAKMDIDLNKCKSFATSNIERIKDLRADLEKYQNEPVDPIAPIDILEKQAESIRTNISALKEKIDEQEKARTTLSNLKATMIDSKTADYNYINFKSLDEILGAKGLQGELVKETLEPIQKDIQSNLWAMGIENEFYFTTETARGKEIFQFGWKDRFGDKRNFDALSTGQQMMLLMAMLVTFMEKANPTCRILAVDNIENLDSNNFKKVINGLNKISNKLDNIIISGVIDVEEVEGFKVWDLNKGGIINEQSA